MIPNSRSSEITLFHYRVQWLAASCLPGTCLKFPWFYRTSVVSVCIGTSRRSPNDPNLGKTADVSCRHFLLFVAWFVSTATSHECHGLSNHWQLDYLMNRSFSVTTKETSHSALVTLCEGNPLVTLGFSSQRPVMRQTFSCQNLVM